MEEAAQQAISYLVSVKLSEIKCKIIFRSLGSQVYNLQSA